MKFFLLISLSITSWLSFATERQVGLYVESVVLSQPTAEKLGIGEQLGSVGMSVAIRKAWLADTAFQYSLGAGVTLGKDENSFSQEVSQGFGQEKVEESSILGFSGYGDIGHSAEFFQNIRSYVGIGSSYFSIDRQILDCADCERQEIDLSFAPYSRIGAEFCSKKYCTQVSYRQFLTDEFNSAISVSFRGKR